MSDSGVIQNKRIYKSIRNTLQKTLVFWKITSIVKLECIFCQNRQKLIIPERSSCNTFIANVLNIINSMMSVAHVCLVTDRQ